MVRGPLAIGIIGGGFMGQVHARAARTAGANLIGVSTSSESTAEIAAAELGAQHAFASAKELLENPDIELVHICTPNASHAALAKAAIAAGKHVICEKPLAVSAAQAGELAESAAAAGLIATVPFVYRFHPLIREARDRVKSGKTGRITSIRGTYLQDWLLESTDDNWRLDPSLGGPSRAFGDIGSHLVDLMEFVIGDQVEALTALTNIVHTERNGRSVSTEDEAVLMFRTLGGAVGTLMVSQVAPGRKNRLMLDISGATETIEFNQEQPETIWIGRRGGSLLLPRDQSQNSASANRYSTVPAGHPMGYVDAFAAFVEDTYKAVTLGGVNTVEGLPTFFDGLRSAKVVEAVLASAGTGSWVSVD